MRVLVTGGTGYLGRRLVGALRAAGHEVVPVSYTHLTLPTTILV